MSTVAFEIVDVFTDRPFAGNSLAVVYGAADLAGDQLHLLAREFNLAETVFILPPTLTEATYRARIFTPEGELPFAGHPSIGAAVTSMRRGQFGAGQVVQECGAGLLSIDVTEAGSATLTGGQPTLGSPLDAGPLLAMTGFDAPAYAGGEHAAPRSAGCGLDWVFLPVRREALADARVSVAAAEEIGVSRISVFAWEPERQTAYARVFCPGASVAEDPATGSAALGLGVWLVGAGWLPGSGTSSFVIHQGLEIKRPSLLDCTVAAADGAATSATVSGHVYPIARGEIIIPPFIG